MINQMQNKYFISLLVVIYIYIYWLRERERDVDHFSDTFFLFFFNSLSRCFFYLSALTALAEETVETR